MRGWSARCRRARASRRRRRVMRTPSRLPARRRRRRGAAPARSPCPVEGADGIVDEQAQLPEHDDGPRTHRGGPALGAEHAPDGVAREQPLLLGTDVLTPARVSDDGVGDDHRRGDRRRAAASTSRAPPSRGSSPPAAGWRAARWSAPRRAPRRTRPRSPWSSGGATSRRARVRCAVGQAVIAHSTRSRPGVGSARMEAST